MATEPSLAWLNWGSRTGWDKKEQGDKQTHGWEDGSSTHGGLQGSATGSPPNAEAALGDKAAGALRPRPRGSRPGAPAHVPPLGRTEPAGGRRRPIRSHAQIAVHKPTRDQKLPQPSAARRPLHGYNAGQSSTGLARDPTRSSPAARWDRYIRKRQAGRRQRPIYLRERSDNSCTDPIGRMADMRPRLLPPFRSRRTTS